jgi:hypothetical protein
MHVDACKQGSGTASLKLSLSSAVLCCTAAMHRSASLLYQLHRVFVLSINLHQTWRGVLAALVMYVVATAVWQSGTACRTELQQNREAAQGTLSSSVHELLHIIVSLCHTSLADTRNLPDDPDQRDLACIG